MGINIEVAGDENSCRATATALTTVSQGISNGATAFHTARSESESLWQGQAGDAFRSRLQPIGQSVDNISGQTQTAAQALHTFADSLITVKSRMNQARSMASAAGIPVNGNVIETPGAPAPVQGPTASGGPPPMTPQAAQAMQDFQTRQQAYGQIQQTVNEARTIESNAHAALGQQMNAWQTMLKDAESQWVFLAIGTPTSVVGAEVDKADEWGELAETRSNQAKIWQSVADRLKDPYDISRTAAQAGVYEAEASKLDSLSASASRLTFGLRGNMVGNFLKLNMGDITNLSGKLGQIAEKIPVLGAGLAVVQTGWDIGTDPDKSAGSVLKHVGSDMGGFVAGTAATEGTLALAATVGLAGGPVTLAAVGIGIGVAYGVGELVNHWPQVQHWAENTAETVTHDVADGVATAEHAIGNAAQSVGSFFSKVF